MIKLLIADDEKMIREGIRHIVDWREYGVEVVGVAVDGDHAWQAFVEHDPDIVITDIRMPGRNGLELTRDIRESGDEAKIVILSGYEDFGFAQEALRLGAADYLLKPVMPDSLVALVLELCESIRREREDREQAKRQRDQFEASLPLLRERFLQELSLGRWSDGRALAERIEMLRLGLRPDGRYWTAAVEPDRLEPASEDDADAIEPLLRLQAVETLAATVGERGAAFAYGAGTIGLIASIAEGEENGEPEQEAMIRLCKELQATMERQLGFGSTIGIGTAVDGLHGVGGSLRAAIEALRYKAILGAGQVMAYNEIALEGAGSNADSADSIEVWLPGNDAEEAERELVFAVKSADDAGLDERLDRLLAIAASRKDTSYALAVSMRLLGVMAPELAALPYSSPVVFGADYELWIKLRQCSSLPELKRELKGILLEQIALVRQCRDRSEPRPQQWFETTVEYLREHYNEPLSLRKLSELVYLSPNYICSLFKEHTGRNISDYLTELRIEKAKELLGEQGIKVYEVAHRVGYADSRYFNKLFKKHTGMNLSDYRNAR